MLTTEATKRDSKMRTRVIACVGAGGALALIAAVVALLVGGADTAIVGAWITVAAAVLGIAGGAVAVVAIAAALMTTLPADFNLWVFAGYLALGRRLAPFPLRLHCCSNLRDFLRTSVQYSQ